MDTKKTRKRAIISQVPIPFEEYHDLIPYIKIRKFDKNEVIKGFHQIETQRRYIISGTVALFEKKIKEPICRRIYSKYSMVWDSESFAGERLTNFSIVAYTDCVVCELPKEIDSKFQYSNSSLTKLIFRVSQQALVQNMEWNSILWLPPRERYSQLPKICPDFALIKVKDISGILNLHERTIYRLRNTR